MVDRDSSVDLATGYGLDGPGIESRLGGQDFPPPSRPAMGPLKIHMLLMLLRKTHPKFVSFFFFLGGGLGSFAKFLKKGILSSCLPSCPFSRPSVRPNGTTLLPVDRGLQNFVFENYFRKFVEKIQHF